MTLKELHCLIEAEKQKEKISDEVLKAAAILLKEHCSKKQTCFNCHFYNSKEGCILYRNTPEHWEV